MIKYVLALGSCHYFGPRYLNNALDEMTTNNKITIKSRSTIYKNGAKGTKFNRLFFNSAACVESPYHPCLLYRELKVIEQRFGRLRSYPFSPRTLDVDVLLSLDFSFDSSNFSLPHKELFNRRFFILPAIEAINLAGWTLPFTLARASTKNGNQYLYRYEQDIMS